MFLTYPKHRSPGRFPEGKVWFPGRVPGRVFSGFIVFLIMTGELFWRRRRGGRGGGAGDGEGGGEDEEEEQEEQEQEERRRSMRRGDNLRPKLLCLVYASFRKVNGRVSGR